jgi:hypothetical protein
LSVFFLFFSRAKRKSKIHGFPGHGGIADSTRNAVVSATPGEKIKKTRTTTLPLKQEEKTDPRVLYRKNLFDKYRPNS